MVTTPLSSLLSRATPFFRSAARTTRCTPHGSVMDDKKTALASTCRTAHTYSRQDRGLYAGTHKQYGNSVSDSHRKTARTWLPNVHVHTVYSRLLKRSLTLRMPASVWRTIKKERYAGSVDAYLTSESRGVRRTLGERGEHLRREMLAVKLKTARMASLPNKRLPSSGAREGGDSPAATATATVTADGSPEPSREAAAKLEGLATGM